MGRRGGPRYRPCPECGRPTAAYFAPRELDDTGLTLQLAPHNDGTGPCPGSGATMQVDQAAAPAAELEIGSTP
jgi:hypothetical protein